MEILGLSFAEFIFISSLLIAVFFRTIYKQVPFSGTITLELAVSVFCFALWAYSGEVRARDLILIKLIALPVLLILYPKKIKDLGKLRDKFTTHNVQNLLIVLFIITYIYILIAKSLLNDTEIDNILVGLYVVLSPFLGYFFSWFIDDLKTQIPIRLPTIFILVIPSIIFLLFKNIFDLERFALGSYAIGGLYAHFALICLLLVKKNGFLTSFFTLLVIGIFIFEIYQGGSRRYMLPVMAVLMGIFITLYGYRKKILLSAILLLVSVPSTLIISSSESFFHDNDIVTRGLGYRDVEREFLLTSVNNGIDFVYGKQLGYQEKNIVHGSKGRTDVGPRLHNYYYTVILNGGFIFLIIVSCFLFYGLSHAIKDLDKKNETSKVRSILGFFLIGWIVSAAYDMPPDGLWPIGLCILWLKRESENEASNTCA